MLKFLLILLCLFLLFRMFTRNMIAGSFSDMQQRMRDEMERRKHANNSSGHQEGHVSVSSGPRKTSTEKGGEYVDYEEVK